MDKNRIEDYGATKVYTTNNPSVGLQLLGSYRKRGAASLKKSGKEAKIDGTLVKGSCGEPYT